MGQQKVDIILRLVIESLDALGISPRQLAPLIDSRREVETARALLDAAARLTNNPDLGIELARATTIRALTPIMYLMMSEPTLGAALEDMRRYALIVMHRPTRTDVVAEKGATMFVFDPGESTQIYNEYIGALLVQLFRYLVDDPQLRPIGARFTHAPPAHLELRKRIFGDDIVYAQPRNALVLSPQQIALPCAHASTAVNALLERALQEELAKAREDAFLVRVRHAIEDSLQGDATMATIARGLGLTDRTLRRRLRERGVSFERLTQDARRERALRMLEVQSASVEAAARASGYADATTFHRAFRAWTGMTPAAYRARLETAPVVAGPTRAAAPPTDRPRSTRRRRPRKRSAR
jgi:AraC-like DNA-binding protein